MADEQVLARMRADWNQRAREDANYYVAFGRREQDEQEFFASAADVVRALEGELKRLPGRGAALEIGCGPGRLLRPMSRHFAEIHGVDVSDEMIRLAQERLRDVPHAHAHAASGSDLARFSDDSFDFVYSYAVFQHIPSRDVVLSYLREARRVLREGGILRCQINGLPEQAARYDTWSGVRISAEEAAAFAAEHDFQLLALEGAGTQYMWTTMRKRAAGWRRSRAFAPAGRIRAVSNAHTGEAAAPAAGNMAAVSLWIEGMPADCDLNTLEVVAEGAPCRLTYLGEVERDGVTQLNARLPAGVRTGLVELEARWLRRRLCEPAWIRVIPPPPAVPRLCSLSDGIDLLSGLRIVTRSLKAVLEEVNAPEHLSAEVDGLPAQNLDWFCTDPAPPRFELNFRLPEEIGPGPHEVRLRMARREFPPVQIEVA